jgi:hypothetical protein
MQLMTLNLLWVGHDSKYILYNQFVGWIDRDMFVV